MKSLNMQFRVCCLSVLLAAVLSGQPATSVVAFTDVSVIPMDRETVVASQTVIVRDGRIAEIGPAASPSPGTCRPTSACGTR